MRHIDFRVLPLRLGLPLCSRWCFSSASILWRKPSILSGNIITINGLVSGRRNFVLCNKSFDISTRCPHRAGEDTESVYEYCRSPVKFGFFRGLIFPIRAQFRNIDIPLLMEPEGSGGPKRNPYISCCSPCLRASMVQRFCFWFRLYSSNGPPAISARPC